MRLEPFTKRTHRANIPGDDSRQEFYVSFCPQNHFIWPLGRIFYFKNPFEACQGFLEINLLPIRTINVGICHTMQGKHVSVFSGFHYPWETSFVISILMFCTAIHSIAELLAVFALGKRIAGFSPNPIIL